MANDTKITHLTGNVGSDPEERDANGDKVVKFSLGVTLRYGEDKETRWVNCSVWQEDLREFTKREISKGSAIAVEGTLRTDRVYNEKQQFDLRVIRIGLVQWAKRSNSGESRQAPKATASAGLGEW